MQAGLDFETFGEVDLPKHGLDNYVNDSTFEPLIASFQWRGADGRLKRKTFDFIRGGHSHQDMLDWLRNSDIETIVAHNASFERAVLKRMFPDWDELGIQIIDSAVIARAFGAGSKLEAAGPQLVDVDKMESGWPLIKKFSMPLPNGKIMIEEQPLWTIEDMADWTEFIMYCELDAEIGLLISEDYGLPEREWEYELITQQMNDTGWTVDIDLVHEMDRVYQKNLDLLLANFQEGYDPQGELNFKSPKQLQQWCKDRGVRVTSLDEQHTTMYLERLRKAVDAGRFQGAKLEDVLEVIEMLEVKKQLGGSSLSKLKTILNTVGKDGKLRGQYMHIGAGQTYRTSGRGVQMQNLKRLGPEPDDMTELFAADRVFDHEWDNERLARNLRQVFTSSHTRGRLIVGDFSSVESRGLAYMAGENWKLDEYRAGKDMYKVLATSMLGVRYDNVTKGQRSYGKVGELSCGYGAGPTAVKKFAKAMGIELTSEEAGTIVTDWRDTNPNIVEFWNTLTEMLLGVVQGGQPRTSLLLDNGGLEIHIMHTDTPYSLQREHPGAQSIKVRLEKTVANGPNWIIMERVFQGAHMQGGDVCYMKPSETKSGDLWKKRWTKKGESGPYKIYGGKLAGILTQSFCREIFMDRMIQLSRWVDAVPGCQLVGQFHDELIVDWTPDSRWNLAATMEDMEEIMSVSPPFAPDFPLVTEVKQGYRYIK